MKTPIRHAIIDLCAPYAPHPCARLDITNARETDEAGPRMLPTSLMKFVFGEDYQAEWSAQINQLKELADKAGSDREREPLMAEAKRRFNLVAHGVPSYESSLLFSYGQAQSIANKPMSAESDAFKRLSRLDWLKIDMKTATVCVIETGEPEQEPPSNQVALDLRYIETALTTEERFPIPPPKWHTKTRKCSLQRTDEHLVYRETGGGKDLVLIIDLEVVRRLLVTAVKWIHMVTPVLCHPSMHG